MTLWNPSQQKRKTSIKETSPVTREAVEQLDAKFSERLRVSLLNAVNQAVPLLRAGIPVEIVEKRDNSGRLVGFEVEDVLFDNEFSADPLQIETHGRSGRTGFEFRKGTTVGASLPADQANANLEVNSAISQLETLLVDTTLSTDIMIDATLSTLNNASEVLVNSGLGKRNAFDLLQQPAGIPKYGADENEEYAFFEIIDSRGESVAIYETTDDFFQNRFQEFLLTSVQESQSEKLQLMDVLGPSFAAFFFGRQPEMITISGVLLNDYFYKFYQDMSEKYNEQFRGTVLAAKGHRLRFAFDTDREILGYPVGITFSTASTPSETLIRFNMQILVQSRSFYSVNIPAINKVDLGCAQLQPNFEGINAAEDKHKPPTGIFGQVMDGASTVLDSINSAPIWDIGGDRSMGEAIGGVLDKFGAGNDAVESVPGLINTALMFSGKGQKLVQKAAQKMTRIDAKVDKFSSQLSRFTERADKYTSAAMGVSMFLRMLTDPGAAAAYSAGQRNTALLDNPCAFSNERERELLLSAFEDQSSGLGTIYKALRNTQETFIMPLTKVAKGVQGVARTIDDFSSQLGGFGLSLGGGLDKLMRGTIPKLPF